MFLFDALVWGEPLNLRLRNWAPINQNHRSIEL